MSTGKDVLSLRSNRWQSIGKDAVFTCMLEADTRGSCVQHLIFKSGSVFDDHEYNSVMLYKLTGCQIRFFDNITVLCKSHKA